MAISEPALMLPSKAAEGDEATNRELNEMLRTEPTMDHVDPKYEKTAAKCLEMWRKSKPLTVETFQYYWDLVSPGVLMTDVSKAKFVNFEEYDDQKKYDWQKSEKF